jgi:hypothetical protein
VEPSRLSLAAAAGVGTTAAVVADVLVLPVHLLPMVPVHVPVSQALHLIALLEPTAPLVVPSLLSRILHKAQGTTRNQQAMIDKIPDFVGRRLWQGQLRLVHTHHSERMAIKKCFGVLVW